MAGIGTLMQSLVSEVVTQLKTITELADPAQDGGADDQFRVRMWGGPRRSKKGDYDAIVKAGPYTTDQGTTRYATDNDFIVIVDLIYWADGNVDGFDGGFLKALAVAEKIYDKFHLTNINNLCRIAKVNVYPDDGSISGTLLAIPIRCTITCSKVVNQLI